MAKSSGCNSVCLEPAHLGRETGSLENDLGNAYLTSQSLSFPLYKRGLPITYCASVIGGGTETSEQWLHTLIGTCAFHQGAHPDYPCNVLHIYSDVQSEMGSSRLYSDLRNSWMKWPCTQWVLKQRQILIITKEDTQNMGSTTSQTCLLNCSNKPENILYRMHQF